MVTQTKTAAKEQAASAPIDPGVRIGHVHLKVADLDRALAFYCGVLGFQLMQRLGRKPLSSPPAAIITISGSTPGKAAAARRRLRARPAFTISPSSIRRGRRSPTLCAASSRPTSRSTAPPTTA